MAFWRLFLKSVPRLCIDLKAIYGEYDKGLYFWSQLMKQRSEGIWLKLENIPWSQNDKEIIQYELAAHTLRGSLRTLIVND